MLDELDALLRGSYRGLCPRHPADVLNDKVDAMGAALETSDPAAGHEDENKTTRWDKMG